RAGLRRTRRTLSIRADGHRVAHATGLREHRGAEHRRCRHAQPDPTRHTRHRLLLVSVEASCAAPAATRVTARHPALTSAQPTRNAWAATTRVLCCGRAARQA